MNAHEFLEILPITPGLAPGELYVVQRCVEHDHVIAEHPATESASIDDLERSRMHASAFAHRVLTVLYDGDTGEVVAVLGTPPVS